MTDEEKAIYLKLCGWRSDYALGFNDKIIWFDPSWRVENQYCPFSLTEAYEYALRKINHG